MRENGFSSRAISVKFVLDVLNALLTQKVARFLFIRMNLFCLNYVKGKPQHMVEPNCFLRVTVEHSLAHIGQWQGVSAREDGSP